MTNCFHMQGRHFLNAREWEEKGGGGGGGVLDEEVNDGVVQELVLVQHRQVARQYLDGIWAAFWGIQRLQALQLIESYQSK